jgi:hypothetical protein
LMDRLCSHRGNLSNVLNSIRFRKKDAPIRHASPGMAPLPNVQTANFVGLTPPCTFRLSCRA